MVLSTEEQDSRQRKSTGLDLKPIALPPLRGSMRQSRLHNFSFPTLSWGNQKLLRCINISGGSMREEVNPSNAFSSQNPVDPLLPPPRFLGKKRRNEEDDGKELIAVGASGLRPWNLRSRRAACNAPREIRLSRNASSSSSPSPSLSHSPLQKEQTSFELMAESRFAELELGEKGERRKFSVALTREEIEEDFLAMKGTKPPRRPKKRAKHFQRQIDALLPGSLLSEVTSDLYKIGM
ncbi:hypothetical protein HPP92_007866 [Vanilla planifolia]|uniref:Uncharacterized protein n=1 Tax=Vanilla planifolia TaxID=51239 RepID=A0A835VB36_VANPL|nr:hypothetical protein HPP92_007866 [Vanilla planifolia]